MSVIHLTATTSNGRPISGNRFIADGSIATQLLTQGSPYAGLVSEIGDRLGDYQVTEIPLTLQVARPLAYSRCPVWGGCENCDPS